jgi:hypothetical protein
MERSNSHESACYSYLRTMMRWLQWRYVSTAVFATLSVTAGTGRPDKSGTTHRKVQKLLIKQYTVYEDGCGPTQSLERQKRVRREAKTENASWISGDNSNASLWGMTRKECHEDGCADKERHNCSCELVKYLMRKHLRSLDNQSSHNDTTESQTMRVRYQ